MRRYRYKVEFLPIEEEQGEKKIDKAKIEETLNSYAAKGWRLRQIALCGNLGLIYVFERENLNC
jgi:hypothetical protein